MNSVNVFSLDDKYSKVQGRILLSGIQALVRLPLEQKRLDSALGVNTAGFISGYRGSPLGGYDKALWQAKSWLDKNNIYFSPGINEDLAATSVWGSQQVNLFPESLVDGVFSLCYGKSPGIDRSGDVLKHSNLAGTSSHGGVLVIAGDDHACKSSTLPHQSDFAFVDAMMPIIAPADVQEIIDFGLFGWALSRYSGLWVGFKIIADIADSSMVVTCDADRWLYHYPAYITEPDISIRWPDTPLMQEHRMHQNKLIAAQHFVRCNDLDKIKIKSENPRVGIVVSGKSWLDTRQAISILGLTEADLDRMGVQIYKPFMIWPLEPERLKKFSENLDAILVIEEKRPLLENQIKEILYNLDKKPIVLGRFNQEGDEWLPIQKDLDSTLIAVVLNRWFADLRLTNDNLVEFDSNEKNITNVSASKIGQPALSNIAVEENNIPNRVPYFCSGCPHNNSTRLPEGSFAGGGIGCHYMATWMNRGTATFTQMGGEGANWIGLLPFTKMQHVFQNLGDGTYFHSGLLAIRAAVAANINITYKILYNDAVAMTGGQQVDGQLTVPQLTRQMSSEGVKHQVIVSEFPHRFNRLLNKLSFLWGNKDQLAKNVKVYDRKDLIKVEEKLRNIPGVTVLIYDQICAAEKRRRRKQKKMPKVTETVLINPDVCEGCGDCSVQSNCLSVIPIQTKRGIKRAIDQSSCNFDRSCLNGFCPSFVTVKQTGALSAATKAKNEEISRIEKVFIKLLPEPKIATCDQTWNCIIAGVGGTGIVTVSALLAVAAFIENKEVYTLDQTGLAQKFGSVTSHIRIAQSGKFINTKIPIKKASLLLGFDNVTSIADNVSQSLHSKTFALVNKNSTTTADFIQNRDYTISEQHLQTVLSSFVDSAHQVWLEATQLAEALTGDSLFANMFMLGFACQKGWLPVSEKSITQAIGLNNVAVKSNLSAFYWGRRAGVDLDSVRKDLLGKRVQEDSLPVETREKTLDQIIKEEVDWLTQYKNVQYAENFKTLVDRVADKEQAISPQNRLAATVAINYSKLLSVKDEYEVARLFVEGNYMDEIKSRYPDCSKVTFYFAHSVFSLFGKREGRPVKVAIGGWIWNVFKLLVKLKKIRGSFLDVFKYTSDRQFDAYLQKQYEVDIVAMLSQLSAETYETAIALAKWPQEVRGFGPVKKAAYDKIKAQRFKQLDKIRLIAAKKNKKKLNLPLESIKL